LVALGGAGETAGGERNEPEPGEGSILGTVERQTGDSPKRTRIGFGARILAAGQAARRIQ